MQILIDFKKIEKMALIAKLEKFIMCHKEISSKNMSYRKCE